MQSQKRKPRLLVVSDSFYPLTSGVAKYAFYTSGELTKYFDVDVITTHFSGDFGINSKSAEVFNFKGRHLKIKRIGRYIKFYASGSQLWITLATPTLLLKSFENITEYDAILVHGPLGLTLPIPLFLQVFRKKYKGVLAGVFHSCSEKPNPAYILLKKPFSAFLKKLDVKFAVSPIAQKEIEKYFGSQSFVITEAGADLERFNPKVKPILKGNIVLFVGRLDERKGADILLLAWRQVKKKIREKWKLVVVGDGPEFWKIKKLAKGLDVLFTGFVTEEKLPSYISSAKFCVFPSKGGECFGIVVVESFACGKPVVVFPPMSYPVKDGLSGLVAKNLDDLTKKIEFLCSNPAELERLGKGALKESKERFNWERVSEKIAGEILKQLEKKIL